MANGWNSWFYRAALLLISGLITLAFVAYSQNVFGHDLLKKFPPDWTAYALSKWVDFLSPQDWLSLLFDRCEIFSAILIGRPCRSGPLPLRRPYYLSAPWL